LSPGRASPVFVLDIEGRPTLAFEAPSVIEASEICADADLRQDLSELTCNGNPVYTPKAELEVRPASEGEVAAFRRAVWLAPQAEQPTMVFLIEVDGVVVVAIDPP
jgi:hypothetical protein